MIPHFYTTAQLEKQLKLLQRGDSSAGAAAACAELIIHRLARREVSLRELSHKRTKHGELRVKHCQKYDLGGGYRLISQVKDGGQYFVFAGSHDACDRWLEKTGRGRIDPIAGGVRAVDIPFAEQTTEADPIDSPPAEQEYEEQLYARLDDKILRQVFRGLCQPRTE